MQASSLTRAQRLALLETRVILNPWIPHEPTGKQADFLTRSHREVLYGGAAGGGKSDGMLQAAAMFADCPGYSALILRRTYPQLSQPGGLIPRSHEWGWSALGASWRSQDNQWTFPSGAVIKFGHLQNENDKYNYQSGEYDFIGFEELTQFSETQYRYLFSRLRRAEGSPIPTRMRSTSNPGGVGHEWVRARFIDYDRAEHPDRLFISAGLADNPHVDRADYEASLMHLDAVTRAQLMDGDWTVRESGGLFRREWFTVVDEPPADVVKRVRYWDMAATEAKPGTDPDWTSGALLSLTREGTVYIEDVRRTRSEPGPTERFIVSTAEADPHGTVVWMEQEPGSSGKIAVNHYHNALMAFPFYPDKVTGSKVVRSQPLSSAAEAGRVRVVRGAWNSAFFDEAEAFPLVAHDDQVDSVSGGYSKLTRRFTPGVVDKPKGL